MNTTSGIALQLIWILIALIALALLLLVGTIVLAALLLPVAVIVLAIILIVRGVKKSKQKKAALDKTIDL